MVRRLITHLTPTGVPPGEGRARVAERGSPMPKRKWKDLSRRQRALILVIASIQLSLAATAFTDLARRPPEQVKGRKLTWVPVIMLNTIGPIIYFVFGVRHNRQRG